uniref:CX domain-containing protein n=1 Tax=Strongyloides stercoralis TaxID=6248 RepID=A0A0K0ENB4_STRER
MFSIRVYSINYNKYFIVKLLIFIQYFSQISGELCPTPTSNTNEKISYQTISTSSLSLNTIIKQKRCPDFKDDPEQNSCCPSAVTPGTFYCCTEEQKKEIEANIASELRSKFIKNYLAAIIVISVITFLLVFFIISLICKRFKCCPLYKARHSYVSTHIPTNYRTVIERIPQKPSIYEAPPPYDYPFSSAATVVSTTSNGSHTTTAPFVPILPPTTGSSSYMENQWNCILENRLNSLRESNFDD